jgi:hypothetical protein
LSATASRIIVSCVSEFDIRLHEALAFVSDTTPADLSRFKRSIDPKWIEEGLHTTGRATLRRRRLPADQVVWLVIGMALMRGRPIPDVVQHLELAITGSDGARTVASSSATQARARLGADPLEWLFHRTAEDWALRSAERDRWRGLSVWAIDGSTMRVADSAANRAYFGPQEPGHRGMSGYPQARVVMVIAARSHLLLAASFGPYGIDERQYASQLWNSIPDDSLTLLDRGYLQADVLVPLMTGRNRHWLTRAKTTTKWTVLKTLGKGDALIEVTVSRDARRKDPTLPSTYTARAIEYQRKGHPPSTLLTSLVDAKRYPANELRALYHERWEVELGFGEIKTDMLQQEETIRSKSPDAVMQELWGVLLAYNLIRLEIEKIADEIGVSPLRISFVAALRYIVDEWGWSTTTRSPGAIPRHLEEMRDKIRYFVLPPRRSERAFPRAVKVKMSGYPRKHPSTGRRAK